MTLICYVKSVQKNVQSVMTLTTALNANLISPGREMYVYVLRGIKFKAKINVAQLAPLKPIQMMILRYAKVVTKIVKNAQDLPILNVRLVGTLTSCSKTLFAKTPAHKEHLKILHSGPVTHVKVLVNYVKTMKINAPNVWLTIT